MWLATVNCRCRETASSYYVLQIPYRDGTIDVRVDDRMYLVSEDVLINESTLNKFGLRVGELLLVIRRVSTQD